jgi:glutamate 5-kinase
MQSRKYSQPEDAGATPARREVLRNVKRVIVKLGSGVLALPGSGLDEGTIRALARQIAQLGAEGYEFVLVSSGAIAAGVPAMQLREPPEHLPLQQAAAAVGQSRLIWAYERSFRRYDRQVAQVLLTHDDLMSRKRYLNARNTLTTLLHWHVLPIINENDTVATDEICFGDNDTLAALIVPLVDADLLIILSHVDGLYTANPLRERGSALLPRVERVTKEIEQMADSTPGRTGRGGMLAKVQAARRAASVGVPTVIACGRAPNVLRRVLLGEEVGTLFLSRRSKLRSRKSWIAHALKPRGTLVIDDGAKRALIQNGKSLLPSGVVAVEGEFRFGDAVCCVDLEGAEVGRGLVHYSASELRRIKGMHTSKIPAVLGRKFQDEVIHRNDLVIL